MLSSAEGMASPLQGGSQVSDYLEFRGKCKELAEASVAADPSLRVVRGFYHCPMWGKQAHWWAVKPDGTIVDPSVKQFPTAGALAEYEEFDGCIECEFCHKSVSENDAYYVLPHAYCSYECYGHDVGF
jgi:hypothetical protein